MPGRQRRNEAVQLAVERNLLENLAAVCLESGAEVVDIDAAELGHNPVGNSRREAPQPEVIDALLAPSADDVIALGDFFDEQRDVRRIVLQVAIHGNDEFTAHVIEAGGEAGGLAEIAPQLDYRDAAIHRRDLARQDESVHVAAVILQHDLRLLNV